MRAVNEGTSPSDLIRALEAHLAKYPNTMQRADVERALAKAAIESNDVPRIAKYGESAVATSADDFLLLDRLAYAFLILGGRGKRRQGLQVRSRSSRIWWTRCPSPPAGMPRTGKTSRSARWASALIYQARARTIQNDSSGCAPAGGPRIFGLSQRGNRPRMGGSADSRGPAGRCDRAPGRGVRHSRSLRHR